MRIALLGYGKMGREIEQIALSRGHQVALKVDANNAKSFAPNLLAGVDVAIEFSTPASAVSNILSCFEANVPVVVGTTGWLERLDEVKKTCNEKSGSLFYASNFSIGVNIFFRLNEFLAKMMKAHPEYEVCLKEIHHIHKLDSPSGTGISLANQVIANIGRKTGWVEGEAASMSELSIISEREGEVPGTHIVKYSSAVDDIEIMHKAHNRKGFALGAVLAAEWLPGRKGVFGMKDMLKL
jgi:4-hydroxy-tetrahydrodipicolinate reductase